MREAFLPSAICRLEQGGAQQADFNEIVEMACLQRSILAIVRERQKLARVGGYGVFTAQMSNSGEAQYCCRSTSPLSSQRCELREISSCSPPIRDTATETEPERCRNE